MKDFRRQLRQQKAAARPLRRNPPRNASKNKKRYCELCVSDEEGPSVYRMLTGSSVLSFVSKHQIVNKLLLFIVAQIYLMENTVSNISNIHGGP
jgi:hypothetical protein